MEMMLTKTIQGLTAETYLEPCQTSTTELFLEGSSLQAIKCNINNHGNIITQGIPSLFSVSKISFIF